MAQFGRLCPALEALLLAQRGLAIEEDAKPLRMAKRLALRIVRHIPEPLCHAVESEIVQQLERWVIEQRRSP